jgi:AcrR family transcriptional regulator
VSTLRLTGAQRRDEIFAAAIAVLLEKGLIAATTRDVTAKVGVGAGLLNHYFSWFELRAAAFEAIAKDDITASFLSEGDEPAAATLERVLGSAFDATADAIWRLWIEAILLAATDPAIAASASRSTALMRQELAGLLTRGNDDGSWTCADPEGSAWRIMAAHDGLIAYVLSSNADLTRSSAQHHLRTIASHECPPPKGKPAKRRR